MASGQTYNPSQAKLYPTVTSKQWKHSNITFRMFFWLWLITTILIVIMIGLSGNETLSKESGGVLVLFLGIMSVFWNFTYYYQKKIAVGDTSAQHTMFYNFLAYLYTCTAESTLIAGTSTHKYWPCGDSAGNYLLGMFKYRWSTWLAFIFAVAVSCGMVIGLGLLPYYAMTKIAKASSKG